MQRELPLLGLLFASAFLFAGVNSNCSQNTSKSPIVAALLDLHSDEQCSIVNTKGLQQLAALESALKQINSEFRQQGIEILLQVFDTCSSKKVAVTAALKALVSSKQTCLHTPLFLGFIGPENEQLLRSIQNLTKIFHSAHILPYNTNEWAAENDRHYYLTSHPVDKQAQASRMLIEKLGWKSLTILFEESNPTRQQAEQLASSFGENDTSCITVSASHFTDNQTLLDAIEKTPEGDGLLILLDNIDWTFTLVQHLEGQHNQVIVFLGKVGLPSWAIPTNRNNQSIFLIQQASASPLLNLTKSYDTYLSKVKNDQQVTLCKEKTDGKCNIEEGSALDELENEQDWTVNLMQYSLMLYGSSLRIAHHIKCKSQGQKGSICPALSDIPPQEWTDLVSKAAVFIKPADSSSTNKKITFQMEVPPKFIIYTNDRMEKLEKVGFIFNETFFTMPHYEFPASTSRSGKKCGTVVVKIPAAEIIEESDNAVMMDPAMGEGGDFFDMLTDVEFLEMLGVVTGLALGSLTIIVSIILILLKSFRVKTTRRSSMGVITPENRSPRGSIDSE